MRKHLFGEVSRDTAARWAEEAFKAFGGAAQDPERGVWLHSVANRCWQPITIQMVGLPDPLTGERSQVRVDLDVKCRKCGACLLGRQLDFARRAWVEMQCASRTWFGTLTLRPEERFRILSLARQGCINQGDDFERLSARHQFDAKWAIMGAMLTKFLKRVRTQTGASLRYIMVPEEHKDGEPHAHILLHEVFADKPVTKRQFQGQWPHGFTNVKLVTEKKFAFYTCKYLGKSNMGRVRTSIAYGQGALLLVPHRPSDIVHNVTNDTPTT